MKNWYCFLVFLFLSTFASYGQNVNVYQHFTELKGMEDYNGNTNLLYRINSTQYYPYSSDFENNIYLLNIKDKTDSLFQGDGSFDYTYMDGWFRSVAAYDFWNKDPRKFIVCGVSGYWEPYPFVDRFDKPNIFKVFMGEVKYVRISRQNDSLIYWTFSDGLYKSTTGGNNWEMVSQFPASSLSPYNDKILYTSGGNVLLKSIDGGLTETVVDSIPLDVYRSDILFYDKDTNYLYSAVNYYLQDHPVNTVLISNNSGNANSWQDKFTSSLPIYLSIDYSIAGSVYLATGKNIYHSTDFGNTFNLFKSFEKNLVGIYKKPGSSKLYTATYNTIYEIDGSTINIIKQIPVDKEIFKFDPLDNGNKWTYKGSFWVPEEQHNFVTSSEIIKDTILANKQNFKQIRNVTLDPFYSNVYYTYERIDSLTGKVYTWVKDLEIERQIDDLSISLGDTINVSRFGQLDGPTSFDSLYFKNIFGLSIENHVFNSLTNPLGYGDNYSLTKDFGIIYHASSDDQVITNLSLKGAIIKGVVYGDTSFVITGINDKYPVQPKEFVLFQNFPNPFNPSTTINYSLPKAGNVKLTIYNAIGSKVATIVNEYKPAGNYSVQFNGSNLASGIYLYRLESGNFSAVKKFILLK
jgi:hypothetical protein